MLIGNDFNIGCCFFRTVAFLNCIVTKHLVVIGFMSTDEAIIPTLRQGWTNYSTSTNTRIKLADLLIVSLLTLTAVQIAYVVVSGYTFPYQSLISGLFSSAGSAVLTTALRIQLTNPKSFANIKPERAFADYLIAMGVLHIAVFNYLG